MPWIYSNDRASASLQFKVVNCGENDIIESEYLLPNNEEWQPFVRSRVSNFSDIGDVRVGVVNLYTQDGSLLPTRVLFNIRLRRVKTVDDVLQGDVISYSEWLQVPIFQCDRANELNVTPLSVVAKDGTGLISLSINDNIGWGDHSATLQATNQPYGQIGAVNIRLITPRTANSRYYAYVMRVYRSTDVISVSYMRTETSATTSASTNVQAPAAQAINIAPVGANVYRITWNRAAQCSTQVAFSPAMYANNSLPLYSESISVPSSSEAMIDRGLLAGIRYAIQLANNRTNQHPAILTKFCFISPAPAGLSAERVSSTSYRLLWANQPAAKFVLEYKLATAETWVPIDVSPSEGETIETTLENISTSRYQARVTAIGDNEFCTDSEPSEIIEFGAIPLSAPTGITHDQVTSTSARVGWNAVTNATDYKVEYRVQGATDWTEDQQ